MNENTGQNLLEHFRASEAYDIALPEKALSVANLHKSYAGRPALQGASFEVDAGERVALLGPNGAGKTTLIRCISGRVSPDSGTVSIFGRPATQTGILQQLGVVPQDLAIYSDLSARENLECFGRYHGLRGRLLRDRVAWALQWIALEDRAGELTAKFSGGMKRRVNIACGVLHRPRVLLLDEPTVGVDPQSRQRIFDMLDELSDLGTSIVLTTHHLDEAQQRTDRIVIVDHGVVIADGTIQELIDTTVGARRRVTLEVHGLLREIPEGMTKVAGENRYACYVDDLISELPWWMEQLERCGGSVGDMDVHTPNLHDVFLHLTGRALRD